ncbi:membrane lipoprotein lipid attachment site-containing protein [Bacillus sp. m3-13]|uniref:membrane lipoprotein lipid attachment site-containing protein n=1 Tax=Bacillus sp. m3-13 TaxID=406124 RepID=UPI0001E8999E|nr:membrane lipoprotein lipid attachment site-containing protein [Bacillus sp. m3-13]
MKKLVTAFCLLTFLTACSSGSESTEEIIIVDNPSTSNNTEENVKDGTLYTKKDENEDEKNNE